MATLTTPGNIFPITFVQGQLAPIPVIKTSLPYAQPFEGTTQFVPKQVAENFKWGR